MTTKLYTLVVGILMLIYGVLGLLDVFPTDLWKAIVLIVVGLVGLIIGLKGGGIKKAPPAVPTPPAV